MPRSAFGWEFRLWHSVFLWLTFLYLCLAQATSVPLCCSLFAGLYGACVAFAFSEEGFKKYSCCSCFFDTRSNAIHYLQRPLVSDWCGRCISSIGAKKIDSFVFDDPWDKDKISHVVACGLAQISFFLSLTYILGLFYPSAYHDRVEKSWVIFSVKIHCIVISSFHLAYLRNKI